MPYSRHARVPACLGSCTSPRRLQDTHFYSPIADAACSRSSTYTVCKIRMTLGSVGKCSVRCRRGENDERTDSEADKDKQGLDLYEFFCDNSIDNAQVQQFEITAVHCQYERKHRKNYNTASEQDLAEFAFEANNPYPVRVLHTTPSLCSNLRYLPKPTSRQGNNVPKTTDNMALSTQEFHRYHQTLNSSDFTTSVAPSLNSVPKDTAYEIIEEYLASHNIEDGVSARYSAIVVYEIWRACEDMVIDNEGFVGQDGETSLDPRSNAGNAHAGAGAGVEGVGGVAGDGVAVEKKDGKMPKVEEDARIVELDGEDNQSKQQAHLTLTFSGRIIRVLRQLAVLFVFTPLLAAARRFITSALLSLFGPLSKLRFWATRLLQIVVSIDWLLPLYWAFDKLPPALKLQLLSVLKHLVSQAASIPGFLAFLQEAFQEKFSVAAAWFQRGLGDYCGALCVGTTDTCIITASTCSVDGIVTTTIRLSDCPDVVVTTTKTETETLIRAIQDTPLPNTGGAALTPNLEFFTPRAIEANTTDPWDSTDPVQITSTDQFTFSRSFSQPEDGLARVTDLMISPSPRTSTIPLPLTPPDSTTSSRTVSPSTALTPDGAQGPTPGYIGSFFNVVADHPYRCGEWTLVVVLFAILYLVLFGRRDAAEEGEEGDCDCDGVQDEMSSTCDLDLLQQATCIILLAGQKLMLGMS